LSYFKELDKDIISFNIRICYRIYYRSLSFRNSSSSQTSTELNK